MDENIIVWLEEEGVVTQTFRKLNPDKKNKLYKEAIRAFAADVFDRVSFDTIAESAEVSKGSLFQYFINKENFLRFVGEIFADHYRRFLQDYFGREFAVKARERIHGFFLAQFDFWQDEKIEFDFYKKMLFENSDAVTRDFVKKISELQSHYISNIITHGAQTGEVRRDIDSERIAFMLSLVFDGMYRYFPAGFQSRNKKSRETLINSVVTLLFDGIGA